MLPRAATHTSPLTGFDSMNTVLLLVLVCHHGGVDDSFTPSSSYRETTVEGFRVLVNPNVDSHADEAKAASDELKQQLQEIVRVVPRQKLAAFRKVAIWMEWNSKPGGGAEFHPSADWLRQHGYNPEKAGGIEISNLRNFVEWSRKTQPCMILHELAHSYHFRVLGENDPRIAEAFRKAQESKKYESVDFVDSGNKKSYALTNKFEYFAESTEAYFGKNDFYPFVREDLKKFDPDTYKLMREIWGTK